jgi:hypothetical protein
VIDALNEGFVMAQRILRALNMAPSSLAQNKKWFVTPWLVELTDAKHFAYTPGKRPVAGDDGDAEVLRDALDDASASEDPVDDCKQVH